MLRDVPAPLLFVETTRKNIHAIVVVFACMGLRQLTYFTLTLMDRSLAYHSDSLLESTSQSHFAPNTANLIADSY